MNDFSDKNFIHNAVELYSDTIFRIALNHTKNVQDAEDIMQEVFITLFKHCNFNGEKHLKAWLIRVTINKSRDFLRKAKIRNHVPLDKAGNLFSEKQIAVLGEIYELPEDDRNIIYLFYYEGYSAKEIGIILDKKEKAVLMRLSRAREKLKYILEGNHEK